ncbi:hypothetical protein [Bacillus sp. SJS]|uniref:hypothetical protein n=1 Tax=Bacillus sp. SJS TaxID=1423321 RepID=UPI0007E12D2C|nr:hypothetical protein [Bacillus sp. SJS]KZZ84388.1 hypothetical protein AS29_011040 [Bacillus sp. SJS]
MDVIYQNVFHYYRGQTKNKDEGTKILQIENNVTKAMLNVLQHSNPSLTINFAKWLGFNAVKMRNFEYRYQVKGCLTNKTPYAAIIGIAESKVIKKGKITSSNIPDAAILSEEISLLIENKIGYNSFLLKEQLDGHKKNFAPQQYVNNEPILLSWKEVRNFFKANQTVYKENGDALTVFLLTQFEEFCIINGIGDRQRSKDYFFLHFEKEKARKLAEEVDLYIVNNPNFNSEDAGTKDGIGYKKVGSTKFATLTTARQRCLILHIGAPNQRLGLKIQEKIDEMLKRGFDRKAYEIDKYPHEAYIRLEWVTDINQIYPFIDYAYKHR